MPKNKKINNWTISLGVVTTSFGIVASTVAVAKGDEQNKKTGKHDIETVLQVNAGNSKVISEQNKLSQLGISTICKDGKGGFYIGGRNGLFKHFDSNGSILSTPKLDKAIDFDVSSITLDSTGGVLISGINEVQIHVDSKDNIIHDPKLFFSTKTQITKTLTSKEGKIYAVGSRGLLSIFDESGVEIKTMKISHDIDVKAMVETDKSIVIGSKQGQIFLVNKKTNDFNSINVGSSIISIQKNNGGVFVKTKSKSLEITKINNILNSQNLNIFKNSKVTNIVSTKDGYIATGTKGHVALLDKSFKVISQSITLQGKDISSIVKDDESGFYIAGDKGLVSHINSEGVENSEEIKTLLDGNDIYGMQRNDQGHIFVFGNSFKVAELDNQGKTIKHFNLLGISSINTAVTKADGEVIFAGEVKTTKVWDTKIQTNEVSTSPLAPLSNKINPISITPSSLQKNRNQQIISNFGFGYKYTTKKVYDPYKKFSSLITTGSNIKDGDGISFLEDTRGNLWSVGNGTPLQFSSDGGMNWNEDKNSKILSSGGKNSLFEDDHGFIWAMGAKSCLQKFEYDTSTSKTGKWTNQNTLGSNITDGSMGSIFQSSDGTLWSASGNTTPQKYDYGKNKWEDSTSNIKKGLHPRFFEDSNNILWFAASGTPLQKSTNGGDSWSSAGVGSKVTNADGAIMFEDRYGTLWIGGTNSPLQKSFDGGNTFIDAGNGSAILDSSWGEVFEDSRGDLWATGKNSLLQKSSDGGKNWILENKLYTNSNIVNGFGGHFFEDHNGDLWSMSENTPIQKYNYDTQRWTEQVENNSGSFVTSWGAGLFYEDSKNNIWISGSKSVLQIKTLGNAKWNDNANHSLVSEPLTSSITDSQGASIFEDSQGRMWALSPDSDLEVSKDHGVNWAPSEGEYIAGKGVILEDKVSKTLYAMITTPRYAPRSTLKLSEACIYKLDGNSSKWEKDTTSNIKDSTDGCMIQDHAGTIWSFGENSKLQSLTANSNKWIENSIGIEGGQNSKIFEDNNNRLWVIGANSSNVYFSDDSGINWTKSIAIPGSDGTNCLIENSKDGKDIWICTNRAKSAFHSKDGGNKWENPELGKSIRVFKDSSGVYWKLASQSSPKKSVDGVHWTSVGGGLDTADSGHKRFYEDSQGTLWITNKNNIQKSLDGGKTWISQKDFQVKTPLQSDFFEDSQGRLWLFTKSEPLQYIQEENPTTKTEDIIKRIRGTFLAKTILINNNVFIDFKGLELLNKVGIGIKFKSPNENYKPLKGDVLKLEKFGIYDFEFTLLPGTTVPQSALPPIIPIDFEDDDGIDDVKIVTIQPTKKGDDGIFSWAPFTNSLYETLKYSTDGGHTWNVASEKGNSFPGKAGDTVQFKYVLSPTHAWKNKPINPSTETMLRIGLGNLESKSKTDIEKKIDTWLNNFNFSKWTMEEFSNSCPDRKQTLTVTSDTGVTATFDISLVPTSNEEIHYEIKAVKIDDGQPILESEAPKPFAFLKGLTKTYDISTNRFSTIKELISPVLKSKFTLDKGKLPSTLIDSQIGSSAAGYKYVDPNKMFVVDFTPNNEKGEIHYSVAEKGLSTPVEGDLSGFYSYEQMSLGATESDILTKSMATLKSFDFTTYTKELFNSQIKSANHPISILYSDKNGYYTWELKISVSGISQTELEFKVDDFNFKEGSTDLPEAQKSAILKSFKGKTITKTLSSSEEFTTFDEMIAKLLKADQTKIATKVVSEIPKIVKTNSQDIYEYNEYPNFKITFTVEDDKQQVKWEAVSLLDSKIKANGIISSFDKKLPEITIDDFKKQMTSGLYDLSKLPSENGQPKTGDKFNVEGNELALKILTSDILGQMTIDAEYTTQLGKVVHFGPIKVFGFKDLSSLVSPDDIKKIIEAKIGVKHTKGIFNRDTSELPSEIYVTKLFNGKHYDIKVLMSYDFADKIISWNAILPNGNSVQNTLKILSGKSNGFPSEADDKIWDLSGSTTTDSFFDNKIMKKLQADNMDHNRLPSDVTTVISKINMERGFTFSKSKISNTFKGYESKKINSQYSIVYNNATKDIQIIDTISLKIIKAKNQIGGSGKIINAFSYDSDHLIIFETPKVGKSVHIQLLKTSDGSLTFEKDVDKGTINNGELTSIEEVSQGKFIYQDASKKLHFLLFDPLTQNVVADEKAIILTKDANVLANFGMADLSTFSVLSNGNFILIANDKIYEIKIDGIKITIVNENNVDKDTKIKKIDQNHFLVEHDKNIYISKFTPGSGFEISNVQPFTSNINISNAIRINAEYLMIKNGNKVYKINIKTSEITDMSALMISPLDVSGLSNVFISIGNRKILYPSTTGMCEMQIATDGFFEAKIQSVIPDDEKGTLEFKASFLGGTLIFSDAGYLKELDAPSSDIIKYINITGDSLNLKIDENLPAKISAHSHLEYSLDGVKDWKEANQLIAYLKTKPYTDLSKLQVKYVADAGYIIDDKTSVMVFKASTTIDNSQEQASLDVIASGANIQGTTIKTILSKVDAKLFKTTLESKGLKLMVNVDGSGWEEFDISSSEAILPQIFDSSIATTTYKCSFDELYDRSKLSLSLKLLPISKEGRLLEQTEVVVKDLSSVKTLIKVDETGIDRSEIIVSGESDGLIFNEKNAININKGENNKLGIRYSLTGGEVPTENMLREIFGIAKPQPFQNLQKLILLLTKYTWFTISDYSTFIKPIIKNMNINAKFIQAEFFSKDSQKVLNNIFATPFATAGNIIIYRDVSSLKNEIISLKDHLWTETKDQQTTFKINIPFDLKPDELAKIGLPLKVREGDKTISDKNFGVVLEYATSLNPSEKDWIIVKEGDLEGNILSLPKTPKYLSMRLKPVEVFNGVVQNWEHITTSKDRTLISNPGKPSIQPTDLIKISLNNIDEIILPSLISESLSSIKITDNFHFNMYGEEKTEPGIPMYEFAGDNGKGSIEIKNFDIPKGSNVFVQWLRPISNHDGESATKLRDDIPKIGYEMYAGKNLDGTNKWVKVAEVKNGVLKWIIKDFNDLPNSWINSEDIKELEVGDHLRFRLHAADKEYQFKWTNGKNNLFSELVYSHNSDPKNNQDDFGVLVKGLIVSPDEKIKNSKLTLLPLGGNKDKYENTVRAIEDIIPKKGDGWIWHYTIYDKDGVIGEYNNQIPWNILKNGMLIKRDLLLSDNKFYAMDKSFENWNSQMVVKGLKPKPNEVDEKLVDANSLVNEENLHPRNHSGDSQNNNLQSNSQIKPTENNAVNRNSNNESSKFLNILLASTFVFLFTSVLGWLFLLIRDEYRYNKYWKKQKHKKK